jgi:hypothetical protein
MFTTTPVELAELGALEAEADTAGDAAGDAAGADVAGADVAGKVVAGALEAVDEHAAANKAITTRPPKPRLAMLMEGAYTAVLPSCR